MASSSTLGWRAQGAFALCPLGHPCPSVVPPSVSPRLCVRSFPALASQPQDRAHAVFALRERLVREATGPLGEEGSIQGEAPGDVDDGVPGEGALAFAQVDTEWCVVPRSAFWRHRLA